MGVPATDPFSAFASSFGGGLGKGVGDAIGGGGPFMGGSSSAMAYGTTLDGSGWIVNVAGQQSATASPSRTTTNSPTQAGQPSMPGASGGTMLAGLGGIGGLLMGVLLLSMVLRKHG